MNTNQRENEKPILRIFFSYAREDRAEALKVHRLLLRLNLRIFTKDTLSAGEDWQSKLKDELTQCDLFIVLLSPNAATSSWVLQELGAAWGLEKPILPIVTHPDVFAQIPVSLNQFEFVDMNALEDTDAINRILERYKERKMS
jgi:hypothetical protein